MLQAEPPLQSVLPLLQNEERQQVVQPASGLLPRWLRQALRLWVVWGGLLAQAFLDVQLAQQLLAQGEP